MTKCLIAHTQGVKTGKEICVEDYFQTVPTSNLRLCYVNDVQDRSILVWFTIANSLNDTFDLYRFILRSIDNPELPNGIIKTLTDFTKLTDFNNSLRIFDLDSGQYEICTEFQSNLSTFIYLPRDGCIIIQIGKLSHVSPKQNPATLLIALATAIVLFFILGLVAQWVKTKRRRKTKEGSRSSSLFSTVFSRQQRDSVIKRLFHRQMDKPEPSGMRQWARNRAFRHRISTPAQEIKRPRTFRRWSIEQLSRARSRTSTISRERNISSPSILNTNEIYSISGKEQAQIPAIKPSFHLTSSEVYEMT